MGILLVGCYNTALKDLQTYWRGFQQNDMQILSENSRSLMEVLALPGNVNITIYIASILQGKRLYIVLHLFSIETR